VPDTAGVRVAYAGLRATDKKSLFELHSWQMPDLGHFPNDTPSNLDAYVSDLFTTLSPEGETTNSLQAASPDAVVQAPSARAMATSVQSGRQASTPATARASMPAPGASGRRPAFAPLGKNQQSPSALPGMRQDLQANSDAQPAQSSRQTPTGAQSMAAGNLQSGDLAAGQATTCSQQLLYAFGRLNLNTCSKAALYSLDDSELITPELVERFDQYRSKRLAQKKVPFLNVSDFLVEFFPRPSEKQLQAFAKLAEQITVSSSSFEVVAENRLPIEEKSDSKRQPTLARVRWAITLDREPYSLINFSIQP
jgi:hypothetical protein